jgi:predicted DNA-binding transcriptional regulator YafY
MARGDQLIRQVNDAVVKKRHIHIRYYSMSRKKDSQRVLAPYKLWFFDGTFYVLGYCRLRNDIRLFALDRIKSFDLMDTTFETPLDFDIDDLLRSSFGAFVGERVKLVVRFSNKVAGYIQEKIWHESQVIEQVGDGSILFKAEVAGGQEIKFWIMKWGADAQVLEPISLRKEIEAEAAAIVRKYREG